MKKQTPLAARYASRAELDARLALALSKTKTEKKKSQLGSVKRKPVEKLARYLAISPTSCSTIRPVSAFRTRAHNLGTQVINLIDHLFVEYAPPLFLYETMLSEQGKHLVWETRRERTEQDEQRYRSWFRAVARGDSFAKAAKGELTSKEAHHFLLAPRADDIETNVVWAKARAGGLPADACDRFVRWFNPTRCDVIGSRLPYVIGFYESFWGNVRQNERDNIADFIGAAHDDESFSMRGRTLKSIRRLSLDWHRHAWGCRHFAYRNWEPALPLWETKRRGHIVRAVELSDSRALMDEGRKQKHCVATYAEACFRRDSRIASMRWFFPINGNLTESARLTIEMLPRQKQVVQVCGRNNRSADTEEQAVVRKWASEVGLTVSDWAF